MDVVGPELQTVVARNQVKSFRNWNFRSLVACGVLGAGPSRSPASGKSGSGHR